MTEPIQRRKRVEVETVVHVCPACWAEFVPTREDKTYCHPNCRKRAHKQRKRATGNGDACKGEASP